MQGILVNSGIAMNNSCTLQFSSYKSTETLYGASETYLLL